VLYLFISVQPELIRQVPGVFHVKLWIELATPLENVLNPFLNRIKVLLGHIEYAAKHFVVFMYVFTVNPYLTFGREYPAGHQVKKGGLPRSVSAQQPVNFTRLYGKI